MESMVYFRPEDAMPGFVQGIWAEYTEKRGQIIMKYTQGSFGRVFILKFEDKDDLLTEIKNLAKKEAIKAGTITLLGGMRRGGIVSGPKEPVIPPEPMWIDFDDGREVVALGTLFWKEQEPVIHLHSAVGRGKEAFVGCLRRDSSVFLVVEAVITEILGVNARKIEDKKTGLVMLEL